MDTREAIIQLPSYLIGDLSPKEAAILEGHLAVNPEAKEAHDVMARQLTPVINLPAPEVGEAALKQLFARAKRELEPAKPVYAWRQFNSVMLKAAAVILVACALIFAGINLAPSPSPILGRVVSESGTRVVRDGDAVEAPQGVPVMLVLPQGEVLIDGSSVVRPQRSGKNVSVRLVRGRALAVAGAQGLTISADPYTFKVAPKSVVAFDLDAPFERTRASGALIELSRQRVDRVARLGEELYGVSLDYSKLPEEVRMQRVSLYGTGLTRDEFLASFKGAARGVAFTPGADGKSFTLEYQPGTAGDQIDRIESLLRVATVEGSVSWEHHAGHEMRLTEGQRNYTLLGVEAPRLIHDDAAVNRLTVWAARSDLDHLMNSGAAHALTADKRTAPVGLPGGTTLVTGRNDGAANYVQMPTPEGRKIIRIGEPVTVKLSDGPRIGKLVSVVASGIEVDVDGKSVFVPMNPAAGR